MAFPSSFQERLQSMEATHNQRLSLLRVEKEHQASKSLLLATRLSNIRLLEQRCSMLDQKVASQHLKISSLKSEIVNLDAEYQNRSQQLRVLKTEVEELEDQEKAKEWYYERRRLEMEEFRGEVESFVVDCRRQVQELNHRAEALKSKHQVSNGDTSNSAIAAAEKRRSELTAMRQDLDRALLSKYQVRAQLQKQIQNILLREKAK